VTPQDAGLPEANLSDLKGGDAETNAAALRALLDGAPGAYRDVVLFGSAAALIVAGKAETLREGVIIAAEAVDSGRARAALDKLVAVTNATS
jgi:anthranilate phosphoribosyltransferase